MKREVICPVCNKSLGKFHGSQSATPLRNHIHDFHPQAYLNIVQIVEEIDDLYEKLKEYGVGHWTMHYFHRNVGFERSIENAPAMTEEQRRELLNKILAQD